MVGMRTAGYPTAGRWVVMFVALNIAAIRLGKPFTTSIDPHAIHGVAKIDYLRPAEYSRAQVVTRLSYFRDLNQRMVLVKIIEDILTRGLNAVRRLARTVVGLRDLQLRLIRKVTTISRILLRHYRALFPASVKGVRIAYIDESVAVGVIRPTRSSVIGIGVGAVIGETAAVKSADAIRVAPRIVRKSLRVRIRLRCARSLTTRA